MNEVDSRETAGGRRRWLARAGAILAVALLAIGALPVLAQETTPVAAEQAKTKVAVDDLESLLKTIEDESRRTAFLADLRALIEAQKQTSSSPTDAVTDGLTGEISKRLRETGVQFMAAVRSIGDVPVLLSWARSQMTEATARRAWMWLLIDLAAALAAGFIAEALAGYALARPRRAVEGRSADTLLVKIPFLTLRTLLDAVPPFVFAIFAHLILPLLDPEPRAHGIVITVVHAYVLVKLLLVGARAVLLPAVSSLRLMPIGDETANYLFIWARRFAVAVVGGGALADAALLFGLPPTGHHGVLRLVGLAVGLMAILFAVQNRTSVALWLGGEAGAGPLGLGVLRRRFADVWHVLAIIYIAGVYGVWALAIEGGFEFLLRATLATVAILAGARLLTVGLRRGIDRGFAINADLRSRYPTLEARANRYLPVLHLILRVLVAGIAAIALLQAWGIDVLHWVGSPAGRRIGQAAFSIAAVSIIALLIWEGVSAAIERYLSRTDDDGLPIYRSARIRTLLPLLRNVVFIALAVMVVLIVLAELGINIAPLLAGAGVVGLAIGFGAQTLVKDIITGLFILVEDTISLGDYVDVAGHSGTVEAMTIRTLRLRDPAGSVHTVPFSDVGTVLNYTKEFAYAVLDIGIGYAENVDEVMAVIEKIGAEMMEDADLRHDILETLEVQGVNSLDDSAVVIRARIKVRAGTQWAMRRAFNRRMKLRFDELGIEIPFPHRTVYFGDRPGGHPPPLHVTSVSDTPTVGADGDSAEESSSESPAAPKLAGRGVRDSDDGGDP